MKINDKKSEFIIAIIVLLSIMFFYFVLIIGSDFYKINVDLYILTSDIIAGASFLCLLYSFNAIKKIIKNIFKFNRITLKIFILNTILLFSILIACFLYYIKVNSIFANLISFICIICSILFFD